MGLRGNWFKGLEAFSLEIDRLPLGCLKNMGTAWTKSGVTKVLQHPTWWLSFGGSLSRNPALVDFLGLLDGGKHLHDRP